VISPVAGWLHEHLYAVVFLGAVVDAIGIPFPGRLMLIAAGSFSHPASRAASEAGASASVLIALATLGTVAGDHVWYLVGRLKGRRLFEIYSRLFRLSDARIRAADRFLRRFGGLAIVFSRIAATLRIVVAPLAVSRGMSYRRFVAFDLLGATLWVTGFVWLGRAGGALASGSGVVGALAVIGALGTASAVVSVLARRRLPASPSCAD
jgi:membrane protein DedA with SNARE-associated domain